MSQKKKANQAQFYFFSGTLPAETFEVTNFSGSDEVSMLAASFNRLRRSLVTALGMIEPE